MSSKAKDGKTFIVLHRGKSLSGGYRALGRYRVGAKNKKEAEALLRSEIGKHRKVRVYYETTKNPLPRGMVVREC